jgi:hypothetical protein
MITDAILDFVFDGASWLVGLLPTSTLDLSGMGAGAAYMAYVGEFVNPAPIATAAGFIVAAELAMVGLKVSLFIWRLTPFSG